MAIQYLRIVAELNLCENCYQKYKALIEPSLKASVSRPLGGWRGVELHITGMVMKLKGVFKDEKTIILSLEEGSDEQYADKVDVKTFQEIQKWGFKKKINFLYKHGILQYSSYKFLDKLRLVRNRIHDPFYRFSEQDLELLNGASDITWPIYMATMFYFDRADVSAARARLGVKF